MAIPGKLEMAPGADRTADPIGYTYVNVTDRTSENMVTVARGKRTQGTGEIPAGQLGPILMGNGDGALTPHKAGTTPSYFPNMRNGMVVRHSINTGPRTLSLTGAAGSRASTADAASWNIGADIGVAVQFRSPMRVPPPGFQYEVVGQFTVAGAQRSWVFYLSNEGQARLRVSSDGTAESDSVTSLSVPRPDSGPLVVGCEFDGDNGAGGNTTTWYVGKVPLATLLASKATYLFGDADVNIGTLTLFNSTGTVGIGDVPGSGFLPYPGCIDAVYVRAGTLTSGTVVTDVDFTTATVAAANVVDTAPAPKTWAIAAPAAITDQKITMVGTLDDQTGAYPGQSVAGTAQRSWTVNGALRRLRQGQPPLKSALFRRVMVPVTDTTVYDYLPLEDGSEATSAFSPITGQSSGILSIPPAVDATLLASDALPSVSGGQSFGWDLPLSGNAGTTTWEHTLLVKIPVAPVSASSEFLDLQRIDCKGGVTSQWVLRIDDANWRVFAKDLDGNNVLSASGAADARMFGVWMIVTLNIGLSGANITYDLDLIPLDGVGTVSGGSGTLASLGLPAGKPKRLRNLVAAAPQDGASFGHFIITSGAVPGWLARADTAYDGEPDTIRAFRLAREEGLPCLVDGPYLDRQFANWAPVLAAGARAMGPQRAGKTLMAHLDDCALVGDALITDTRELLGINYRSGSTLLNQTARLTVTSEVTSPLTPTSSDRYIVNDATVSRIEGSSARYVDAASASTTTGDGLYQDTREINSYQDTPDLLQHAAWWVNEALWPEERYDTVPLELAKGGFGKLEDFLNASPGDLLVATALPSAEAGTSLRQLMDGWTVTLSPHLITARPTTRPEGPWVVGVLDSNPAAPATGLTRIGSEGTAVLAGSLSSVATGAQSVTVTGKLWTITAGYFPLDVLLGGPGGEIVTLSAIAGGASPQTFTISARSVNGTVAAWAAGTAITPAHPFRLAKMRAAI